MKMPTREELQRWVDVISDDATRKAIQAKLDTDPDFVREEIDRVIQQALDEAAARGDLTPIGLNDEGKMVYQSNIYRGWPETGAKEKLT
jgi:hypothetical protein